MLNVESIVVFETYWIIIVCMDLLVLTCGYHLFVDGHYKVFSSWIKTIKFGF